MTVTVARRVFDKSALEIITAHVASAFDVPPTELRENASQYSRATRARQTAMWMLRDLFGVTLDRIGAAYDRDYSTVAHALRMTNSRIADDAAWKSDLLVLRQRCLDAIDGKPVPPPKTNLFDSEVKLTRGEPIFADAWGYKAEQSDGRRGLEEQNRAFARAMMAAGYKRTDGATA